MGMLKVNIGLVAKQWASSDASQKYFLGEHEKKVKISISSTDRRQGNLV